MAEEKKFYLTKQGLEKIKKEYEELKKIKLEKSKNEVPKIWESEDVNPEYLAYQDDMGFLESKLEEIEYILKNGEVIKTPKKELRNIVGLGATVTLTEENGQINEFIIVGTLEANPNEGKISSESPVGRALLGKKIGEEVLITSPIKVVYKIKDIKYHIL